MSQVVALSISGVIFALGVMISVFFQNVFPAFVSLAIGIVLEIAVARAG